MNNGIFISFVYLGWLKKKDLGCPYCNGKLRRFRMSNTVYADTEEAKDFDLTDSEGGTLSAGYFSYVAFDCSKCWTIMKATQIKKSFNAIRRMERQQTLDFEGKQVCYLYDINPLEVHKHSWYCSECGEELWMKSVGAAVSDLDHYKYKWMPFYRDGASPEESIIRRVCFICPECVKEYSTGLLPSLNAKL